MFGFGGFACWLVCCWLLVCVFVVFDGVVCGFGGGGVIDLVCFIVCGFRLWVCVFVLLVVGFVLIGVFCRCVFGFGVLG